MNVKQPALPTVGRLARGMWVLAGLGAVGLGAVGIVVPGLPTTVFFVVAAWCFSRSSPRLERWVLDLPRIGPFVRDYRAGLGMPRRAKVVAISMIVIAVGLSVVFGVENTPLRIGIIALGLVGIAYIALRVPTRERVLQARGN